MTPSLAEAKLIVQAHEAEANTKRNDELRQRLSKAVHELEAKLKKKVAVDRAITLSIAMDSSLNDSILQILGMISEHNSIKPSHSELLPDCDCRQCVIWQKEDANLSLSHKKLLERRKNGTADPNADALLQRHLATAIINLERSISNLEAQLRGQPNGRAFEGGISAVR